jgi:hypothetical protein
MTRKFLTPIILPADPTAALQAATKQYVDGKVGSPRFSYTFNDAAPAPASGEIRLIDPGGANAHGAATSVTFSNTTADGALVTTRLSLIRPGNLIYLYTVADPTRWQAFQATASPWDNGTYSEVTVTVGDGGFNDFLAGAMSMEVLPGLADEVAIGPSDPGSLRDLWVDTDEVTTTLSEDQRWNTAWGIVAEAMITADVYCAAGADVTGLSVTFNPVVGRRYIYQAKLDVTGTVAGDVPVLSLRDGTGATTFDRHTGRLGGTASETWSWSTTVETFSSSAAVTRKLNLNRASGTGTLTVSTSTSFPAKLTVEDVGPISNFVSVPNPVPSWIQATLVNGWVTSGVVPSYRRIGDIVYLRGAASGTAASAGSTILTLPVGYRPPANVNTPVVAASSTLSFIAIDTNGNVIPTSGANKDYISVSNVQFSVTP